MKMVLWIPDTTCADPRAELAEDVRLGRYCVVGPEVRIERGAQIGDHVWLGSSARVGAAARIGDYSVIGHRTWRRFGLGGAASIHIGAGVWLGRGVVIAGQRAMGSTRIGSESRIEGACRIGAGARLATGVMIGSGSEVGEQVRVESRTQCGSGCRIRKRVRIGRNVVIGALSEVANDVPPHVLAEGRGPILRGVNVTGLQRIGVDPRGIIAMNEAFVAIVRKGVPVGDVSKNLDRQGAWTQEVREFVAYFAKSADAVKTGFREPGRVA